MSSFLLRANSDQVLQEDIALIKELSCNPQLRELGWAVTNHSSVAESADCRLRIGDPNSRTSVHFDKSVLEKTDRILRKLGWNRSWTGVNRKWSYQKSLNKSTVIITLTWMLNPSKVSTNSHPLGKGQYPIQHIDLYIDRT